MKQIIQYLYNVHFFYVLISDEIVQFQEQERILIWFNSVDERRCRDEHRCRNERRCRNEHGCRSHEPGRDAGTRTLLLLRSTYILVILFVFLDMYWNCVWVGKEIPELHSEPIRHNFITGRSHDQRFIVIQIRHNRVHWLSQRVTIPYRISGI